jgi:hypothetical protein
MAIGENMNLKILLIATFLISNAVNANVLKGNFQLKESKIDYLVKYLIKKADAQSTAAKGKGQCNETSCDFIVGAPVKSFESKDASRDLNMLNTTKADKYPLVSAKIKTNGEVKDGKILADLEIDFGGVTKTYSKVPFNFKSEKDGFTVTGGFDLILDNHKIEKPSLLGVDIENLVPITISAKWVQI